jgi:hypothetical protein
LNTSASGPSRVAQHAIFLPILDLGNTMAAAAPFVSSAVVVAAILLPITTNTLLSAIYNLFPSSTVIAGKERRTRGYKKERHVMTSQ